MSEYLALRHVEREMLSNWCALVDYRRRRDQARDPENVRSYRHSADIARAVLWELIEVRDLLTDRKRADR